MYIFSQMSEVKQYFIILCNFCDGNLIFYNLWQPYATNSTPPHQNTKAPAPDNRKKTACKKMSQHIHLCRDKYTNVAKNSVYRQSISVA